MDHDQRAESANGEEQQAGTNLFALLGDGEASGRERLQQILDGMQHLSSNFRLFIRNVIQRFWAFKVANQ